MSASCDRADVDRCIGHGIEPLRIVDTKRRERIGAALLCHRDERRRQIDADDLPRVQPREVARQIAFAACDVENSCTGRAFAYERFESP